MPVLHENIKNNINSALTEKILHSQKKNDENNSSFGDQLIASTKRVLFTKIEYEESTTQNYANVFDKLKCKYSVLKLAENKNGINGGNVSYSSQKTQEKGNGVHGNDRNGTGTSSSQRSSSNPTQLPQPKKVLFPRENVQLGWHNWKNGRKWNTGVGMMNAGNTCYLNSTLQALFHVPAIANWLSSDADHKDRCEQNGNTNTCIICAMANTLQASQTNQGPIKPSMIYSKLKYICKHLTFGRQEDAHEFLRYLIEAMEKSYLNRFKPILKDLEQYSKETTPLNQILGGYLRTTVTCLSCQHVSITFQHFEDLLLDISRVNNMEDALSNYFARENLEESGYKCESCKRKVSATKKFSLERAPLALCIQLKRFNVLGNKLIKSINIGEFLDLKPYLSKTAHMQNNGKYNYRLVSMVTHIGNSQHCGHYTAIGLSPNSNYYQFDDSCVRPVQIDSILRTHAYILFYELESHQENGSFGGSVTNGILKNGVHSKLLGTNSRIDKIMMNVNVKAPDNTIKTGSLFNKNGDSSNKSNENPMKAGGVLKNGDSSLKCPDKSPKTPISYKNPENSSKNGESLNQKSQISLKPGAKQENETTPKVRSFVTPFVPSCLLKQQQQSQSKQDEAVTPTKSQLPSPPTTPTSQKPTISVKNLFASPKKDSKEESRGIKHGLSEADCYSKEAKKQKKENIFNSSESEEDDEKKMYPQLPHMPKLLDDSESPKHQKHKKIVYDEQKKSESPMKRVNSDSSLNGKKSDPSSCSKKMNGDSSQLSTSQKPKSLVPYDTDEEESDTEKKVEKLVKNQSGVWKVCDLENVNCPSKKGSTVESTKVELNGFGNHNKVNGLKNGSDVVQELEKLSHRGYGAPVNSWKGQPTQMDREIARDKQEERKRQLEDDRETEMDRGRTKKLKYGHDNQRQLPNPFHEKQNALNRSQSLPNQFYQRNNNYNSNNSSNRFFHSRPNNHNFHNQHNNNNFNRKYSKFPSNYQRNNNNHNNHHHNNNRNSYHHHQQRR